MANLKSSIISISIITIIITIGVDRFWTSKKTPLHPLEVERFGLWADALNQSKTITDGSRLVFKSYKVTTEDGYVLNLNRIINPDNTNTTNPKVPVLLVNGLGMHSEAWLLQMKPEINLPIAYLLEGYDVWLGDQRGTIRSQEHLRLKVDDWHFWDFSFHEVGVFDLPAFIDFILGITGQPKLVYSGISQAASFYYVMCAERQEYQEKLYGGILWQPMGETPPVSSMPWNKRLKILSVENLLQLEWSLGVGEAPPLNHFWRKSIYDGCSLTRSAAVQLATAALGKGCHWEENICLQIATALGGTSARSILHTIQLFKNGGVFNQYDYGTSENYIKYGQKDPPIYDVTKLRVFTALYTSNIDPYAPTRTVETFSKKFSGLTYTCETKGVCHGFVVLDPRAEPVVRDSIEVLNSMTGRTSYHKMSSRRCHIPTP